MRRTAQRKRRPEGFMLINWQSWRAAMAGLRRGDSILSTISPRALTPAALRTWIDQVRDDVYRRALSPLAREVLARNLTYLSPRKLYTLERCAAEIRRNRVPGDVIECGVALGGSAIVLAARAAGERRFQGYDVFGMIPPPSERDDSHSHERYTVIRSGRSAGLGEGQYYGYIDNLRGVAMENFGAFGFVVDGETIVLHQGLFEDTMHFHPGQRIALAHVDCDWHDAVEFCLDTVYRRLTPGGMIVLDDYNDYGGCRRATDAFLEARHDMDLRSTRGNAVLYRHPIESS